MGFLVNVRGSERVYIFITCLFMFVTLNIISNIKKFSMTIHFYKDNIQNILFSFSIKSNELRSTRIYFYLLRPSFCKNLNLNDIDSLFFF